ncbi:MAG: cation transporter [Phycisphaerales bacterium]|nr:cation transporter [Phycisphaerales bacterium]
MITGMCDNRCRERIVRALERVPGIVQVDVSLLRARATVLHERRCEPITLVRTVIEVGYDARMAE